RTRTRSCSPIPRIRRFARRRSKPAPTRSRRGSPTSAVRKSVVPLAGAGPAAGASHGVAVRCARAVAALARIVATGAIPVARAAAGEAAGPGHIREPARVPIVGRTNAEYGEHDIHLHLRVPAPRDRRAAIPVGTVVTVAA